MDIALVSCVGAVLLGALLAGAWRWRLRRAQGARGDSGSSPLLLGAGGFLGSPRAKRGGGGGGGAALPPCYDGPLEASIKLLPFAAVERATGGGFERARLLGMGGFGPVYLAHFRRDELGLPPAAPAAAAARGGRGKSSSASAAAGEEACAVKTLDVRGTQGVRQFLRELAAIATCNHPSLLPLLAAVNEPGMPICLVTPYMPNGSLTSQLRKQQQQQQQQQQRTPLPPPLLPWHVRLQIAIDSADALLYLHTPRRGGVHRKPAIVHRDVKPDNLLLDARMRVRVADFGLARELVSAAAPGAGGSDSVGSATAAANVTCVAGTVFYIDPEYQESGELTPASDCYSFGMVLLQLLTGAHAPVDGAARPPGLLARVRPKLRSEAAMLTLGDKAAAWPGQAALVVGTLVEECVRPRRAQRPPMARVLSRLRELQLNPQLLTSDGAEDDDEDILNINKR